MRQLKEVARAIDPYTEKERPESTAKKAIWVEHIRQVFYEDEACETENATIMTELYKAYDLKTPGSSESPRRSSPRLAEGSVQKSPLLKKPSTSQPSDDAARPTEDDTKVANGRPVLKVLENDTALLGMTLFFGALYLYLALSVFHASYFLLLLDSPKKAETWWVHMLAWVWRSGLPVLVGSLLMGWNTSLHDDRITGMFMIVGGFPTWVTFAILFTLFVDIVDELVFHSGSTLPS